MFRLILSRQTTRCISRLMIKCPEIQPNALAVMPRYFSSLSAQNRHKLPSTFQQGQHQGQVQTYSSHSHSYTDLSYEEFLSLLESKDIQLFDVREPEECRATGIIPSAVNIPLGEVKKAFSMSESEFVQKYRVNRPSKLDRNVIFYGLGPIKSTAALELVHKVGYKNARHYIGGWEEWQMRQKAHH